jgi:hypothetical protein
MKADIIRQLNQQNTLDNMIPLTEFSSESELQELEKRGYNAWYTAESWKAEFPEIDPKYMAWLFPEMYGIFTLQKTKGEHHHD